MKRRPADAATSAAAEVALHRADLLDRLAAERRESRYRGTAAVTLGGFNIASTVGLLYRNGSDFPPSVWVVLVAVASASAALLAWWWRRSLRRSGALKAELAQLGGDEPT